MKFSEYIIPLLIVFFFTACSREYDEKLKMVAVKDSNTIWIMNTDGTDQKALTNTSDDGVCTESTWSTDCKTITYISYKNSIYSLYLMNSDGENKKLLYTAAAGSVIYNPAFYPDGSEILFGVDVTLYRYDISTGKTSVMDNTGVTFGGHIFFISISAEGWISVLHGSGWAIYKPVSGWAAGTGSGNYGFTFSPDCKYIAYSYYSIMEIAPVDTTALDGAEAVLSLTLAATCFPAWDPSGEYVYYNNNGIWRVRVDGTDNECVVPDSTFSFPQIQGKSR